MINLNWIKDYIDISDQDLNELATKITKAGVNIEKVITNIYKFDDAKKAFEDFSNNQGEMLKVLIDFTQM